MTKKSKRLTAAEALYRERVKRRNAEFQKMTPAEKRVAVARDVLKQLRARKLVATSGVYMDVEVDVESKVAKPVVEEVEVHDSWTDETTEEPVISGEAPLDRVLDVADSCQVCAVGALFACAVGRKDKLKVGDVAANDHDTGFYVARSEMEDYLDGVFDFDDLHAIESSFEGDAGSDEDLFDGIPELNDYGIEDNDAERMRLIMENIVANGGSFDPARKPVRRDGAWRTPGYKYDYRREP